MESKKSCRGAPRSVTIEVNETALLMANNNIKQFFKTRIKKISSGGAYISMGGEYTDHDAFVIVLEKKIK